MFSALIFPLSLSLLYRLLTLEACTNRSYADIGGMDIQKQEIREAVELPLTQFDLYRQIGIEPPRGVLLYGPPGESTLRALPFRCVQY